MFQFTNVCLIQLLNYLNVIYSDGYLINTNIIVLQHSLGGSDHYQLFELKVKWKNDFQVDGSVKNGM